MKSYEIIAFFWMAVAVAAGSLSNELAMWCAIVIAQLWFAVGYNGFMRRRADKVDCNQSDIVKALRRIPGVSVEPGHDDIIVGYRGATYWFEIKDPQRALTKNGTLRANALTPSETSRLENWQGHYEVVWSVDQILNAIKV